MWTHRAPYKKSRLTRDSIRYHGRAGLYRALNIGNMVGFIGSGVTVAYGRPNWRELVQHAYDYVQKQYEGFYKWLGITAPDRHEDQAFGLEELWTTLKAFYQATMKDEPANGERLKIALEMCENLARSMDLYANRLSKRCYHAIGLRHYICKQIQREKRGKSAPSDVPEPFDPLHAIYHELGIRRFLTVNYDSELERFLHERTGFTRQPFEGRAISELLGEPIRRILEKFDPEDELNARFHPLFAEHPTHLTGVDNLGRTVESVRLVKSSLGDLINFAALPSPHDARIFHLHGRVDDPRNIMLTEGDYQRAYVSPGLISRTFDETLDTLFLGNEVLFIGLGMNEADLLRPLRQFVVADRLADVEARRIFALLPFYGEQQAVTQALDLKIRYGVQTLFFGEGLNWLLRNFLGAILKWFKQNSKTPIGRQALLGLQRELKNKLREVLDIMAEKTNAHDAGYISDRDFKQGELEKLRELASRDSDGFKKYFLGRIDTAKKQMPQPFLDSIRKQGSHEKASYDIILSTEINAILTQDFTRQNQGVMKLWKSRFLKKAIEDARSALQTEALCAKISALAEERLVWWEDWLTEPKPRVVPYAYLDGSHTVCVRHSPCYKSGPRSSMLKNVQKFQKFDPNKRRILRLASERGRGKGSFFHELQTDNNYKTLTAPEEKIFFEYKGAFFAHTSFSPEFSSVVAALVRFVARHIATERDIKRAQEHLQRWAKENGEEDNSGSIIDVLDHLEANPWLLFPASGKNETGYLWHESEKPNNLSQLRLVLRRLKDNKSSRLFICLSGLERLCDRAGNAYSAAHRAFFRLLTDEELEDTPLDLVLISGDPDHPIRYLSEQEAIGDKTVSKPWHRLPDLPMSERFWLMREEKPTAPTAGVSGASEDSRRYVSSNDLKRAPILDKLMEESVAHDTWISLCAKECFECGDPSRKQDWIIILENAAGRNRHFEVLSQIFQAYREIDPITSELHALILHHLSFFSLPIQATILLICPDIRRMLVEVKIEDTTALEYLIAQLTRLYERGLVIRIDPARPNGPVYVDELKRHFRYTLHGQMRQYLAAQMRFALPDRGERNYYGISLYTVQPRDLPTPSEVHFRQVYRIVEELLYAARRLLQPFYSADANSATDPEKNVELADQLHAMTHQLRAAYSILRESFSIGSLSRLKRFEGSPADPGEPYEIYRGLLGALIGAAVGMHCLDDRELAARAFPKRQPKMLRECLKGTSDYPLAHPFFRQEILWLINERGLTAFVQGRLYDSIPLFNQALRIARQVTMGGDGDDSFRTTERRVLLNLAIAEIERSNIRTARRLLESLAHREQRTKHSTPSITKDLAEGYLGLCDHLGGHLQRAETRYLSVLKNVQRLGSMRNLAIFHRHYADLLRLLRRFDDAKQHLRLAMLAAARDEQKDVFQYVQVAQARLHRDIGERETMREATRQLDEAERYARELGLIKLEVDAMKTRSTVILAQGETEQAGRLAARAAGLANRHGMELHKITALITHGRILLERGQTDLAHSLLSACAAEADRRGYQLAAVFAGRLLRNSTQPLDVDELGTIWNKGDPIR